jgi:hypothetical protein
MNYLRMPTLRLTSLALALCLSLVWVAPSVRAQTVSPTPTTTPQAVMLTIEDLRITPGNVVAGDPFVVAFSIWNRTEFFIEQLAITVKDLDADALLTSSTGVKTIYYNQPGRGILVAVELKLVYAGAAAGTRRLALLLDSTYYAQGQRISRNQAQILSLQVAAPPPTPTRTPTFTPTPTRTPTATSTRRPTLAPSTVDYPATQIVLLKTMTAQERPAPSVTPTETRQSPPPPPPPQPRPLPPPKGAVVIEFADVPPLVAAQQVITMTLVVRNLGGAEISGVVARFDTATSTIVPIGRSTQWFLDAIRPAGQQALAGQFWVAGDGPLGQAQVMVAYEDADGMHETMAEINIPVAQPAPIPQPTENPTPTPTPRTAPQSVEPWWLSILRAIFGGGK